MRAPTRSPLLIILNAWRLFPDPKTSKRLDVLLLCPSRLPKYVKRLQANHLYLLDMMRFINHAVLRFPVLTTSFFAHHQNSGRY